MHLARRIPSILAVLPCLLALSLSPAPLRAQHEAGDRDQYADTPAKKERVEQAKQTVASAEGWDYFTTPHYVVLFRWEPKKPKERAEAEKKARESALGYEKFWQMLEQEFPLPKDTPQTLMLVGGPVPPAPNPMPPSAAFHYCKLAEQGILGWGYHNVWHAYLQPGLPPGVVPHVWFNEGLGDYYGFLATGGGKRTGELDKQVKQQLRTWLREKDAITIGGWLMRTRTDQEQRQSLTEYAYRRLFIWFLRSGQDSMGKQFDPAWSKLPENYYAALRETREAGAANRKALQGIDVEAMDKVFRAWTNKVLR